MHKKAIVMVSILIVVGLTVASLLVSYKPAALTSSNTKVVTTLFPLYDMASSIGGGKTNVTLLLPPGVEPHTYEPSPADLVAINEADVFVYTGEFMEPWAEDVLRGVNNKDLVVINASEGVEFLHSGDPHVWLDFDNAKIMAKNIAQGLMVKDEANNEFYGKQLKAYDSELSDLDMAYKNSLTKCQSKEIFYAGHYAFGYLAKRYGLQYVAAQGISPDAEPTVKDLVAMIEQIKQKNAKYVFYEELTSPKIAETIADETDAKLLLLNAAHNLSKDQFEAGVTFLDILNNNLASLKTGLGCY